MSDVAIQVQGVWKKFRKNELHDSLRDLIPAVARRCIGAGTRRDQLGHSEFWALRDVSFEVQRGQSLGIIGPNGAGKSTMLKLLSRILRPNRGTYRVNGRLSALIEIGAGFHTDLTGRENIYLNGTILGMSRKVIRAREQQIIEFAGIESFIDTPVKRYSSGMAARLGFAVAAHMDPDVLLVDEVLSVGDVRFREKCIRHMHDLIRSDVTVIFISHILEQVRSLCPNTLVLDMGQVVYGGPTDGAIGKYLEILSDAPSDTDDQAHCLAELRDVRLCDADGKEVLQWTARQPAVVECQLIVHEPVEQPAVVVCVSTLSGVYLGAAHSKRQGLVLPTEPGTYPLRFTFDPMPLSDGEYSLEFQVRDVATRRRLWTSAQPRVVSIRGTGFLGTIVPCDGQWELMEQSVAPPPGNQKAGQKFEGRSSIRGERESST